MGLGVIVVANICEGPHNEQHHCHRYTGSHADVMSGTGTYFPSSMNTFHIPGEIVMDDEDADKLGQEIQVGQAGDAGVVLLPLWDLGA